VLDELFPLAESKPSLKQRVPVRLSADALESYVGTYEVARGMAIVVTREPLFIQPTNVAGPQFVQPDIPEADWRIARESRVATRATSAGFSASSAPRGRMLTRGRDSNRE
jgi:hypothetical protein